MCGNTVLTDAIHGLMWLVPLLAAAAPPERDAYVVALGLVEWTQCYHAYTYIVLAPQRMHISVRCNDTTSDVQGVCVLFAS